MTSYFANSYIPDLRNGTPDPYQTCGTPVNGTTPDPSCDPRNSIHHYGSHPNSQGQLPYPRFPPYDRLDIRHGGNPPVSYYQGGNGGGGQMMDNNQYRPPSPCNAQQQHVVNMGQQQTAPTQYSSCKMQQQTQHQSPPGVGVGVPQHIGPPLSPDPSVVNVNGGGTGGGGAVNGNHHPQQHQHHHNANSHNHMAGMYNSMAGGGTHPAHQQVQHVAPQQQQQPNQGQQPPLQHPHHPNPNPHQSPQQQNSPAAALPSPLYPWMRSQFVNTSPSSSTGKNPNTECK